MPNFFLNRILAFAHCLLGIELDEKFSDITKMRVADVVQVMSSGTTGVASIKGDRHFNSARSPPQDQIHLRFSPFTLT